MAKEWEKFQPDYKKLKPAIEKHSASAVSAVYKRLGLADANLSEGESNLAESTVAARKNGVSGTGLPDYMKDKTFAEAKKLLDHAVGQFVEALTELDSFADDADKVASEVGALYQKIEKDLKSRKDKSESTVQEGHRRLRQGAERRRAGSESCVALPQDGASGADRTQEDRRFLRRCGPEIQGLAGKLQGQGQDQEDDRRYQQCS